MRNKHKGTTRNAATLNNSPLSFETAPIQDQSPLYPASMNPNPNAATAALGGTVFKTLTLNGNVKFSGVVESSDMYFKDKALFCDQHFFSSLLINF
ncbi:hypothetical protein C1H46_007981 [Malus baccata]|uniref:Uncharacterized protein n=1 Tax=Malus baccata TaxID=106549 RepID=A0A540N610_MALBA|nr:hypothetical protein C1H46_007981 [Malus baccata]